MFDIIIREATLSDQEAINVLSLAVYQYTDFTSSLFPEWVNDDKWLPFVAQTHSGQVVGFLALNITDGKRSVVERSSRVAERFRGRGIYKKLLNSAITFAKQKFPNLNCIIRGRPSDAKVPVGYKVLKHSSRICFSCTSRVQESVHSSQVPNTIVPLFNEQHLTVEEVAKLYKDDENFRKLFDGDILVILGEMFHMNIQENWTFLQKRNDIFFMYTKHSQDSTKTGSVISVFCVSSKKTNGGKPYISINIFGKDVLMACYHIHKAIEKACLYSSSDYCLAVVVDTEIEEPVCEMVTDVPNICHLIATFKNVIQEAEFESHFLS